MVVQILLCQHCGSDRIVRNGRAPNGKQRFLCHTCGRQCRQNPSPRGYSEAEREQILRTYQARSSLRGLQRTFGVAPATVAKWLKKVQSLPPLSVTVVEPPQASGGSPPMLECDEVRRYVGRKATPVWLWIAFARHSRQIVAYALGDRTEATAHQLWNRLPPRYREAQAYTDGWEPYAAVIPVNPHRPCPKRDGRTAHVERWNNTLRQRLARYTQKTLAFSKSIHRHEASIRLFLHSYNLDHIIL